MEKTMSAVEFAELKKCNINKVQDAIHGRGAQELDSILISLKGQGRRGSRQRRIIMNEKAEKFVGGVEERFKPSKKLIEDYLRTDTVDWNRPAPVNIYGYAKW